jgi:hydrogenase nickel incorporation protein HypA/HybF
VLPLVLTSPCGPRYSPQGVRDALGWDALGWQDFPVNGTVVQEEELYVHELAICESIARTVTQHAAGRPVRAVKLRVGALRQVVPDSLVFCWSIVARDPVLQGSVLDIEPVAAEVECVECGARSPLSRFVLRCPACEGLVSVLAGEELLVVSIDVEDGEDGENVETDPPATASGPGSTGSEPQSPGSGEQNRFLDQENRTGS